jgi:hypothetical protein
MSRFRKIDPRIWNDAKFRALSDHGRLVTFLIITHPNMTSLGAMRATPAGLAQEIGWSPKAFQQAFGEVLAHGIAEHDPVAHLIALPNFIRYNAPQSPNVVKAWAGAVDLLPECALKTATLARARLFAASMPNAFRVAFDKAFGKPMPNKEKEKEQKSGPIQGENLSGGTTRGSKGAEADAPWTGPMSPGSRPALKVVNGTSSDGGEDWS